MERPVFYSENLRDKKIIERLIDFAVFGVLTIITQVSVWSLHILPGSSLANSLLLFVSTTALLWRRRRPLDVLLTVISILMFQTLAFGSIESAATLLPFVVAIYSVARSDNSIYLIATLCAIVISVQAWRDPNVKTVGDALFTPLVSCSVFILGKLVHVQHRKTEIVTAKVESIQRQQTALVSQTIAAERERIARELHDVIAHGISVMALQAGAANQVMDADPRAAKNALRVVRETGHDVVREMERLVSLLDGKDGSKLESVPSLDSIDARIVGLKEAGIQISFCLEGHPRALSPAVELAGFRIIQEGLTNVLKHAPECLTKLVIRYHEEGIDIEMITNSVSSSSPRQGRRGLIGIAERVAFLKGRHEIGPYLDGWRLFVFLPEPA